MAADWASFIFKNNTGYYELKRLIARFGHDNCSDMGAVHVSHAAQALFF
jgi:hypothetical protein